MSASVPPCLPESPPDAALAGRPELAWLRQQLPKWQVDINTNRSVLLSMRRNRLGPVLRVHSGLLDQPECLPHIAAWARQRGGRIHPDLRRCLRALQDRLHHLRPVDATAQLEPTLGRHLHDLDAILAEVHRSWFADLDQPRIAWSRQRHGTIRAIRFGSYLRRPQPIIRLHPRLDRPWVATVFVLHVIHHEMCHHRQHRQPAGGLRREAMHSPRFRAWEAAFPGFARARRWERAALPYLLGDTVPPWYPSPQEPIPPCAPPSC